MRRLLVSTVAALALAGGVAVTAGFADLGDAPAPEQSEEAYGSSFYRFWHAVPLYLVPL